MTEGLQVIGWGHIWKKTLAQNFLSYTLHNIQQGICTWLRACYKYLPAPA